VTYDRKLTDVPESVHRLISLGALIGIATLLTGVIVTPQRMWANFLLVSFLLVSLGLAGTLFIALANVTGAGWSVAFRRVPEAMTAVLPFGAAGLLLAFLFHRSTYPWIGEQAELTGFRHIWLDYRFFLLRALVYLGAWLWFSRTIVRNSQLQDEDGDPSHSLRNVRLSAAFLVVFAITFWLASFDWIMSLEPDWSSTMFGVYNFAGMFSGGIAVVALLVIWLQRLGPLSGVVNEEHLHDLGKMLFAFSTFWMYIWFSQYMLIWYAHIPEETVYFARRLHGNWQPLFVLNLFLNWVVPFVVLLNRPAKRSGSVLTKVALVVLLGRWLDLYLMMMPSADGRSPQIGAWEIGAMVGAASLFLAVFLRAFRKVQPVPSQDPYLVESLHYHH
jgi:hypothetical protein